MAITENIVGEEPSPVTGLPGTRFALGREPIAGTLAVYANGLRLFKVGSAPVGNTYTLSSNEITLGFTADADAVVIADYDAAGFEGTKGVLLGLVDQLSLGQADLGEASLIADDVFIDLAHRGWLVNCTAAAVAVNQATYALPATAVVLLATFYDDDELSATEPLSLDAVNADWRSRKGRPLSVLRTLENDRAVRVTPTPRDASAAAGAAPLGENFPDGAVHFLYLEQRTSLPEWLVLPATLLILAREFSRESDHRDLTFSAYCQQLADALLVMVS